jgi:hypothetical protein
MEQAFSDEGDETWETNWAMQFIPAALAGWCAARKLPRDPPAVKR